MSYIIFRGIIVIIFFYYHHHYRHHRDRHKYGQYIIMYTMTPLHRCTDP